MQLNLGFDLDEVVVNIIGEIEKYLKYKYDIYWPAEYFKEYGLIDGTYHKDEKLNKTIQKDLWKVANSPEFQMFAEPFNGAKKALLSLKKAGHRIFFITSRPKRNKSFTVDWLERHDIPFDEVKVIGHSEEKGIYGTKLNLDMFVDDLEKHLVSMFNYKKTWSKGLLLFDRPWNIRDSRFDRVKNWKEIVDYVED
ncbi:HAD hydrolase-like protein, partial [candidate division WOR-3 bacterium]|nr:HAD hydrolase-like protein [candidate division WOR-3 bacterium]